MKNEMDRPNAAEHASALKMDSGVDGILSISRGNRITANWRHFSL
jgi:hypothetical protein